MVWVWSCSAWDLLYFPDTELISLELAKSQDIVHREKPLGRRINYCSIYT